MTAIVLTHMSRDSNMGDYAILAATYAALQGRFPGAKITISSVELGHKGLNDPDSVRLTRALGAEILPAPVPPAGEFAGPRWRWMWEFVRYEVALGLGRAFGARIMRSALPRDGRELFDRAAEADLLIAKGGSYLHAIVPIRDLPYLWRMLLPIRLAKRSGVRIVLLGVSLGEFRSRPAAWFSRVVLRAGVSVVVREEVSCGVARTVLKLPASRIKVAPDMAFLTPRPIGRNRRAGGLKLGLTVRRHPAPKGDAAYLDAQYADGVAQAVSRCLEIWPEMSVTVIPQVEDDEELGRTIARKVDSHQRVTCADRPASLTSLMEMYDDMDVMLAARLHSVILAAVCGVPAVHVIYEPSKSLGTLKLLGMTDYGIPYESADGVALTELLIRAISNRQELSDVVQRRVVELRSEAAQAVDRL
jgi:polysaccharide pyruvyl transferase WcaK-like protein